MGQSLPAQTASTGALAGTLTDPTGAVVPNVTVTVTSIDTGQSRTATTDAAGTYKVGLLPPGDYRVKFEASGFKGVEVPSITVNVTETNVLDRRLEVGTQSQQVTVQGEVENVQTSNATVGTVMTTQIIADLPLTTRNYTNLLGLTTGANTGVFNAATLGRGTQAISVNGSTTFQNNFQMDGVSIMGWGGNGGIIDSGGIPGIGVPNPDAIQEFKIQTSLYDAGYGRNPGANVNVVTKSGTNAFHGTAFEFFRNTVLNANDFFRKISPPVNGAPNNGREVLDQNQYGGVFGGPVKKDKLFFFASYEETSQRNGLASVGFSAPILPPIPQGARNTPAFQAALGAAICPANNPGNKNDMTFEGGVQVACNGANINPVALNLLNLKNPNGSYLIPSSSNGAYQNTTFSIPALYTERAGIGNIDYVINGKNTLSGRYFYTQDPTLNSFNCGNTTPGPAGICLPGTNLRNEFWNDYAVLKLTTILNNNTVNEARVSYQRNNTLNTNSLPSAFTDTAIGMATILPGVGPGSVFDKLNGMTVTGLFTIGSIPQDESRIFGNNFQVADQVSWTHGKHTVRTGLEIGWNQKNWNFLGLAIGNITFDSFPDFLLGLPGCAPGVSAATCSASEAAGLTNGTSFSNIFNTGTFSSVTPPNGIIHAFRARTGNAFIQDDFKVTRRLTVNLGLRWEYDGFVWDKYGEANDIWPAQINTVPIPGSTPATGTLAGFVVPSNFVLANWPTAPVGGIYQNTHRVPTQNNPQLDNFAPRVGLAWQPTNSDRFVVRSGFGFFYDYTGFGLYDISVTQAEPYAVTIVENGSANYFSSEAQPYAPTPLQWTPRWVNFASGASSNIADYIMQQKYVTPLTYEYNLNTQYEFLPNWVLEVGYVGSHGIHQSVTSQQINGAQLVGNPLGTNTINAPGITAGLVTTNTVANASLRVPYLGFAPTGLNQEGVDGYDKFNSLQVTLRKQMSHGLSMQAAYTWSRAFTTGASTTTATATTLNSNDPNNAAQQYGLSGGYYPQRLALNYSWDLPFGHPDGLKGKLVSGWNLSGVTILQDGEPLTITDTRGGTIFGSVSTSRAEYCAGMGPANVATPGGVLARLGGATGGPGYFTKAAFCPTPAVGNGTGYGDSGVSIILGPGQFNWDMALVKTTKVGGLREDATLQFRTEFFNAFNHPQFNNPAVNFALGSFGQITTTSVNPRLIQFALKYAF
jgi:hypothetical protein